jgi:hypothetical protein
MEGDQTSLTTRPGDVYDKLKRNTMGTPIVTERPVSTGWEKPQAKEGFDISKPDSGIPKTKPLTAPVASNANRDALRAIVSREI